MDSSLNSQQQDTRYRILYLLKVIGPQTVKELAAPLAISSMGIRQHLVFLEGAGWIHHHQKQRGLGRPKFVYTLTEKGDEQHFPRAYAPQMVGLLRAVQELDGADGLDRIFEQHTEQLVTEYRDRISSEDLEERVKGLASIRTEEGFMAEWEKENEDSFVLWEHNCAIHQVAHNCAQACIYEHELFCRVLDGADVTRESHILSGEPKCSYVIQRNR
jgi:DeoR family suf operon transcriptional repressor